MKTEYTGKTNGTIMYIEPNDLQDINHDNVPFNYEDYCMAVDLEVVVPNRYDCGQVQNFRFYSSDSTQKISFLGGTNGMLTTTFTDISSIDGAGNGNKETLGIKSIKIEYKNYYVPNVKIVFTDVRGTALMQPEEEGYAKALREKSEIMSQGSFFRSLFTFPFPLFKLKVKGFYGKPVTYYLTVKNFDTSFDSNTGNFEVSVDFIGYMYGVYTDIPMNMILLAPYCSYIGANYWSDNASKGGKFTVDGKPMPRFLDLMSIIRGANPNIERNLAITSTARKIQRNNSIMAELSVIMDKYTTFTNSFTDTFELNQEITDSFGNKGERHYFFIKKIGDWYQCDQAYNELVKSIDRFNTTHPKNTLNLSKNDVPSIIYDEFASLPKFVFDPKDYNEWESQNPNAVASVKNMKLSQCLVNTSCWESQNGNKDLLDRFKERVIKEVRGNAQQKNEIKVYGILYGCDFREKIASCIAKYKESNRSLEETLKKEYDAQIEELLGFKPSVKNIVKIVFAHIETFMQMFYHCTSVIKSSGRNFQRLGLSETATDVNSNNGGFVPPFPLVLNENTMTACYPSEVNGITEDDMEELRLINELVRTANGDLKTDILNSSNFDFLQNLTTDLFLPCNPYKKLSYGAKNMLSDVTTTFANRLLAFIYLENFGIMNGKFKDKSEEEGLRAILKSFAYSEAYNIYKANKWDSRISASVNSSNIGGTAYKYITGVEDNTAQQEGFTTTAMFNSDTGKIYTVKSPLYKIGNATNDKMFDETNRKYNWIEDRALISYDNMTSAESLLKDKKYTIFNTEAYERDITFMPYDDAMSEAISRCPTVYSLDMDKDIKWIEDYQKMHFSALEDFKKKDSTIGNDGNDVYDYITVGAGYTNEKYFDDRLNNQSWTIADANITSINDIAGTIDRVVKVTNTNITEKSYNTLLNNAPSNGKGQAFNADYEKKVGVLNITFPTDDNNNSVSVFGSKFYYMQEDERAKAMIFLQTLPLDFKYILEHFPASYSIENVPIAVPLFIGGLIDFQQYDINYQHNGSGVYSILQQYAPTASEYFNGLYFNWDENKKLYFNPVNKTKTDVTTNITVGGYVAIGEANVGDALTANTISLDEVAPGKYIGTQWALFKSCLRYKNLRFAVEKACVDFFEDWVFGTGKFQDNEYSWPNIKSLIEVFKGVNTYEEYCKWHDIYNIAFRNPLDKKFFYGAEEGNPNRYRVQICGVDRRVKNNQAHVKCFHELYLAKDDYNKLVEEWGKSNIGTVLIMIGMPLNDTVGSIFKNYHDGINFTYRLSSATVFAKMQKLVEFMQKTVMSITSSRAVIGTGYTTYQPILGVDEKTNEPKLGERRTALDKYFLVTNLQSKKPKVVQGYDLEKLTREIIKNKYGAPMNWGYCDDGFKQLKTLYSQGLTYFIDGNAIIYPEITETEVILHQIYLENNILIDDTAEEGDLSSDEGGVYGASFVPNLNRLTTDGDLDFVDYTLFKSVLFNFDGTRAYKYVLDSDYLRNGNSVAKGTYMRYIKQTNQINDRDEVYGYLNALAESNDNDSLALKAFDEATYMDSGAFVESMINGALSGKAKQYWALLSGGIPFFIYECNASTSEFDTTDYNTVQETKANWEKFTPSIPSDNSVFSKWKSEACYTGMYCMSENTKCYWTVDKEFPEKRYPFYYEMRETHDNEVTRAYSNNNRKMDIAGFNSFSLQKIALCMVQMETYRATRTYDDIYRSEGDTTSKAKYKRINTSDGKDTVIQKEFYAITKQDLDDLLAIVVAEEATLQSTKDWMNSQVREYNQKLNEIEKEYAKKDNLTDEDREQKEKTLEPYKDSMLSAQTAYTQQLNICTALKSFKDDVENQIFTQMGNSAFLNKEFLNAKGFAFCSTRLTVPYGEDVWDKENQINGLYDSTRGKDTILQTINDMFSELRTLYNSKAESKGPEISVDLKLSTYMLLKNLYDKWLCAISMEKWDILNPDSEFKRFKFMDSYYNNIEDTLLLDMESLGDDLLNITTATDKNEKISSPSIYSFLQKLNQDSGCIMIESPALGSFSTMNEYLKIFKPMSYLEMTGTGDGQPAFLWIYPHEGSRYLSAPESQYRDDSFDIADTNGNLVFPTKLCGDKPLMQIPAFSVSFGKQNQNMFKSFNINMQGAQMTDVAIANTLQIADNYGKNPATTRYMSQDLFRVYANKWYMITVEMMGNASISPLMYFQLNNVPMFKGTYRITQVSHSISAGEMTTSFTGVRMSATKMPIMTKPLQISNFLDQIGEIEEEEVEVIPYNDNKVTYFYYDYSDFIYPLTNEARDFETLITPYGENGGLGVKLTAKEAASQRNRFTEAYAHLTPLMQKLLCAVAFSVNRQFKGATNGEGVIVLTDYHDIAYDTRTINNIRTTKADKHKRECDRCYGVGSLHGNQVSDAEYSDSFLLRYSDVDIALAVYEMIYCCYGETLDQLNFHIVNRAGSEKDYYIIEVTAYSEGGKVPSLMLYNHNTSIISLIDDNIGTVDVDKKDDKYIIPEQRPDGVVYEYFRVIANLIKLNASFKCGYIDNGKLAITKTTDGTVKEEIEYIDLTISGKYNGNATDRFIENYDNLERR